MDKNTQNNSSTLMMELKKLGLSEKEAVLYLIILEKNEVTASKLAFITNISRPTVYRILEDLEQKNLVNKIKKQKKTLFVSTSPDTLLGLLKIKRREAEEQERELLRIISTLQSTYALKTTGGVNELDIEKGTDVFVSDLSNTPTDEILTLYSNTPKISKNILHETYAKIQKRLPDISVKEICTNQKDCKNDESYIQTKIAKSSDNNFSIVAADRVFIITDNSILIIDHKDTAEIIKSLLRILWNNL